MRLLNNLGVMFSLSWTAAAAVAQFLLFLRDFIKFTGFKFFQMNNNFKHSLQNILASLLTSASEEESALAELFNAFLRFYESSEPLK